MTKPVTMRPRKLELLGGLMVLMILAGMTITRSGPATLRAEDARPVRPIIHTTPRAEPPSSSVPPGVAQPKDDADADAGEINEGTPSIGGA